MSKLLEMKSVIVEHLDAIEAELKSRGLTRMTRLTLIARDPTNDKMTLMVSSEPSNEGIRKAFRLAIEAGEINVKLLDAISEALKEETVQP